MKMTKRERAELELSCAKLDVEACQAYFAKVKEAMASADKNLQRAQKRLEEARAVLSLLNQNKDRA